MPVQFLLGENGGQDFLADDGFGFGQNFRAHFLQINLPLRFPDLLLEVADAGDDFFDFLVGKLDGGVKVGFGDFLGRTFDHDEIFIGADVDEIQIGLFALGVGGVGNELATDSRHADRAEGAGPRNVRDAQRGRSAVNREDVGIVFAVRREQDNDNLCIVVKAFWEQGPAGAVNHAGGENFFFGRPSFPFEIATRESACGGRFFTVIDGEREEIEAFPRRGGDDGDQKDRFAELDDGSAVGLFGKFASFDGELTVADTDRTTSSLHCFLFCLTDGAGLDGKKAVATHRVANDFYPSIHRPRAGLTF